jgi:hypothetical protein
MEVLLATSILLACVVVLAELAEIGRRHYVDVDQLTTAQLICQSKLNEIVAGAAPLQTVEEAPVAEVPGWVYSVDLESHSQRELVAVRVTVAGQPDEGEGSTLRRKKSFTLTRWMHAPDSTGNSLGSAGSQPNFSVDFDAGEGLLP